ncbi:DUF808 domain-containing protein [Psychrobacter sanguinis]|uniref:DUF808 domain-containing protein n=1 Tax=Psychrobacter sanguinis TaxID=861445 RepID=UPI002A75AA9D|nr:DUF808 domain-containing protein [Psychrobacter sanguinis]MDY3306282.1 DUF808 domain-containing protein [Psychrobacter sanguinis]
MASGLLLLLDDIATILDDVAVMSKMAAKKTAGVLGDDLALNAQQVAGVKADRELPVVWSVAKGSFVNKLILVPLALIISVVAGWLINPLLMIGGLFLCYEGVEKLVHMWHERQHKAESTTPSEEEQFSQFAGLTEEELMQLEKDKIKGAVRTDFILSAEIVVISLGTMTAANLVDKSLALSIIAIAVTIGIYGLVGFIVKIDDIGLHMMRKPGASNTTQKIGQFLLSAAPKLMKVLTIVGTLAMFLVGGGIIVHGVNSLEHAVEDLANLTGVFEGLSANLLNGVIGFGIGLVVLFIVTMIKKMRSNAH